MSVHGLFEFCVMVLFRHGHATLKDLTALPKEVFCPEHICCPCLCPHRLAGVITVVVDTPFPPTRFLGFHLHQPP